MLVSSNQPTTQANCKFHLRVHNDKEIFLLPEYRTIAKYRYTDFLMQPFIDYYAELQHEAYPLKNTKMSNSWNVMQTALLILIYLVWCFKLSICSSA